MKLNSVVLALGAILASVKAAPANLSDSGNQEVAPGFSLRIDHATLDKASRDVPETPFVAGSDATQDTEDRGSVSRSSHPEVATNVTEISISSKKALGPPLIEEAPEPLIKVYEGQHFSGPPLPFIGKIDKLDDGRIRIVDPLGGVIMFGGSGQSSSLSRHGIPPGYRLPCRKPSFWKRLISALTSLGTWERRAVAFVLIYGLVALLRTFWVLSVITLRVLNGANHRPEVVVQYRVHHHHHHHRHVEGADPPAYTPP